MKTTLVIESLDQLPSAKAILVKMAMGFKRTKYHQENITIELGKVTDKTLTMVVECHEESGSFSVVLPYE